TANGQKTYTWRAKEMRKFERESGALSRNYYNPHIILRIDRIKRDNDEERVLSDVTDLYRWYSSLVQEINQTDQAELKQIVADLVEGVSDEREKARLIYQWVQSNISYVAFEDGMGGFIPRDAAAVCTKKYGDCKDMANLTRVMLDYAGVEAYLTWIGTRDKPYSYFDVPTPVVDNHMITAVKLDGQIEFLDATGTHTPFGYPTSMIQGKEALVGISADSFAIIDVPVMEPTKNQLLDSTFISLEDGTVKGRGTLHMTGYQKVDLEYTRYRIEGQDEKLFMNDYLTKGKDNFQLDNFTITGLGDPNLDGEIDYEFHIPSYAKSVSDRIYVNLNLDRPLQNSAINLEQRRYGREIDYQYVDRYFVELQIPDGYSVYKMPENLNYEDDKWGFQINYRQDGDKIILEKEIYLNTLAIHKSDFEDWNTFVEKLIKAHKKNLVLSR
ncbi:MAG: transglutaminase-like domain-containing protein, partial [Bacteroidota bacterium]